MRARLPVLICAALSVGLSVVAAAPASAKPLEREHYSDTFEETFDCDDRGLVTLHLSSEFSGLFMLKAGQRGGPPRFFDNYSFVDTYTNVETGNWVTVSGNGNFRDLKITHVEGTVYNYVARFSGQGNVVRDMAGNVLLRSSGSGTVHAVIDTKGDTDLDNDVELSFEVVRVTGRDDTEGRDFCEDMLLFTS